MRFVFIALLGVLVFTSPGMSVRACLRDAYTPASKTQQHVPFAEDAQTQSGDIEEEEDEHQLADNFVVKKGNPILQRPEPHFVAIWFSRPLEATTPPPKKVA